MSLALSATTWAAIGAAAAVAGTAYTVYSGERAASAQSEAMKRAKTAADAQATQADQAMNKANPKRPDIGALLAGNAMSAKAGVGGTMLTGPTGVDPAGLTLGRNTLLGG